MRFTTLLCLSIGLTLVTATPTLVHRQGSDTGNAYLIYYYANPLCSGDTPDSSGFADLGDGFQSECFPETWSEGPAYGNPLPFAEIATASGGFLNCTFTIYSDT